MALVSDIVYQALRKCRFRNTNDTTRVNEALAAFNLMLKTWGEGLVIPTRESFTLTAGTESYTIGSGGDFDSTRPIAVLSAFIRDSDGTDYDVDILMTVREYDQVSDKDASERPDKLYYAAEYSSSLGKIYFNSAPDSAETFYLTSHKSHSVYTAITETLVQPPEYEAAMVYNLAVDMAEEIGLKLSPSVYVKAERYRQEIERRNIKPTIAEFDMAMLRT